MIREFNNYSLLKHNTFNIDVNCKRFLEFDTQDDARHLVCKLAPADQPLLVIGGGSNLLLTGHFAGTVVHSAIKEVEVVSSQSEGTAVLVRAGSGVVWDELVAYCIEHGWHGMENLSLIPGEVGASAVQNIGAYGAEVASIIDKVEAIDMATAEEVEFKASDCNYGYRQSRFKGEWRNRYLITYVTYKLSTSFTPMLDYGNIKAELERKGTPHPTPLQLRQTICNIRRNMLPDPSIEGNAGSFFINVVVSRSKLAELQKLYPQMPFYNVDQERVKIPTGWLIEQCGWKGRNMGRAGVHSKQSLVLVNRGGASGKDILRLCDAIRADVSQKFGLEIHPEVNII